ncbi:NAD(P)H-binding protein [Paucibacter sp. Y2R2-4]|uniref:NAD(P)H-binding protein n=1 Tax=Paucibacter sp. Y2R2-4 TaxID=2893553 RepID=UPI0021E4A716|nr:NAD(P)H-binding protein [Paucibacter sp. Y2R2-4]MCV2352152.1 NAD(P)H-binding protein [Paucibacter sp. Y2R2-4]
MSHMPQTLWLAGATGLIGRALLEGLLPQALQLELLLRRPATDLPASPRVHPHLVDFSREDLGGAPLPPPQAVLISLGSTMAQAGSAEAFRAVDFEAVLHVAQAAKRAGASRCAVVSALGADANSKVFYNQVKGEMEQALVALQFDRLVIARPSLLRGARGARAALGQPDRPGERWALTLTRPLQPLIPLRWRPIDAAVVARALCLALRQAGPAVQVLESQQLQTLGALE